MTGMKSLVLAGLAFSGLAQAALAPYYTRTRELDAILKESRVETAVADPRFKGLSSGVIDGVRLRAKTSQGNQYEVSTGSCKLDVNVKTVPQTSPDGHPIMGPGKLELLVANSLRC